MKLNNRCGYLVASGGMLLLFISLESGGGAVQIPAVDSPEKVAAQNPTISAKEQVSPNSAFQHKQAIDALSGIYKFILIYRSRKGGTYPTDAVDLFADMASNPLLYGFTTDEQARDFLINPDNKSSDDPAMKNQAEDTISYVLSDKRLNGTLVGGPVKIGNRDVLAYTGIYYRENKRINKKGEQAINPTGSYLVLWSDSIVESVPYDLALFSSEDDGYTLAFRNQAGLPFNSVSYPEFWSGVGPLETPPLGKPVPKGKNEPVTDNGGPESLLSLSRRLNIPNNQGIDRDNLWVAFDPAQAEFTLADVQKSATKLGLDTQIQKLTLTQLQKSGTPALLFLKDDGRIVTLTALDDDRAVVIDRGLTRNVERSVLEARYSGESLVPINALPKNASIVADDAVRKIKLPALETEFPQQFTLRNTGTTPITLQLESPLLGVTESKLSKDTLAPGETATLNLKVKWRPGFRAFYQNVLISLRTSDPIVPRLQLAIVLTPPKDAGK